MLGALSSAQTENIVGGQRGGAARLGELKLHSDEDDGREASQSDLHRELERRWAAARKRMAERNIDALVMQNNNDWLGGHVRWFTDTPLSNGYPRSVIFPAADLMTVVDMGARGARRKLDGADEANRGVGEMIFTPAFTSVAYTDEYQAELVAEELDRSGYRTIGWVGSGAMPHKFVARIERELAGKARFVDATEFIDGLKAIKSGRREAHRKCAEMQDEVFYRVLEKIRPGMTDNEIAALAQYEGRLLGSEQGLFLGSSAPLGRASRFVDRHQQARTLKPGEHFTLLIENNGPGGMYTEIARTIVLGKASNELIDGFEIDEGGAGPHLAPAQARRVLRRGRPKPRRLHAQPRTAGGASPLRAWPGLRPRGTAIDPCRRDHEIQEHMNSPFIPATRRPSIFAVICEIYLIEADGPGACLHKTPKQVFEL